jgi:hypothetical protein
MGEDLLDGGHVRVVGSGGGRETEIEFGAGESEELRREESESEEEKLHKIRIGYNFYKIL